MVRTRRDTLCFAAEYRCYSTIERFIWDGDQLLSEFRRNGANNQLEASLNSESSDGSHFQGWVRYTHAGGIDEPLAVWKLNSDGIVPHLSWRGTFEAGSDIVTGALLEGGGDTPWIWPARYTDIHLAPELRMPNATPTRWLGSLIEGQVDLNGLAYRRNRYYDPSTGRFTQEDPIGLAGGLNLYGFANGDPVNFSDPFGLFQCNKQTGDGCSDEYRRLLVSDAAIQSQGRGPVAEAVIFFGTLGRSPASSLQGARLGKHLEQLEKYGEAGFKTLESGVIRYYGSLRAAAKQGEMVGRRLVREWNPLSNATRTWHETLDGAGRVRIVRPETLGEKIHFFFDAAGRFIGKR